MRTIWWLAVTICLSVALSNGMYIAAGQENIAANKETAENESAAAKQKEKTKFLLSGAAGTFRVVRFNSSNGKIVTGAPYSATAITDFVQTLGDGNQIIRKNQSRLYRDSRGRTRIEQTLETIGKWAADGEPRKTIYIGNAANRWGYNLDPATKTACRTRSPEINSRFAVAHVYLKPIIVSILPRLGSPDIRMSLGMGSD
ncbi:MAG TPA: hypothetical protein VFV34_24090, partial [Blastocatellia bacterium]|nr:hypothetical protein [Blastocatellia bacterium]